MATSGNHFIIIFIPNPQGFLESLVGGVAALYTVGLGRDDGEATSVEIPHCALLQSPDEPPLPSKQSRQDVAS